MSNDENMNAILRWFEILNIGDIDQRDELFGGKAAEARRLSAPGK